MSEPKLISPMLDDFAMGEPISNHHGVRCCPAMPNNSDSRYIVKIISIPASQVQLRALLLTGAYQSESDARDYFHELAQGITAEVEIIKKLSRHEGFLPFEGCQIVPMEADVGYDVYLLSPYKRSLERHFRKSTMTHLAAVNLGLDVCAALAISRQAGYLYANLKPSNIFLCDNKEYRVGDIGFLRLDSLKFASLPDRCISAYTAPEIVDAFSDVNPTIDIYAVGLILYQAYNGGVLPFEGRAPAEALPAPAYADYEMAEIILKACAPDPKDRWQDPIAMGQALISYMQRNSVNDVPIVMPLEEHVDETPVSEEVTEVSDEDLVAAAADLIPAEEEQICLDEFYDLLDMEAQPEAEPDEEEAGETPAISADSSDDAEESEDDALMNLSFLDDLVSDDTAPSEDMAPGFAYDKLSDDAMSILSQADDLISHETPEGVVAPEPIDVPMPAPIVPQSEEPEEIPEPEESEEAEDSDEQPDPATAATAVVKVPEADADEYDEEEYEEAPKKKSSGKTFLVALLILLLLAGLAFGGYMYYKEYYLCTVNDLVLTGSEDILVVSVDTEIDDALLTVYCTDTHGNSKHSPLTDGKAEFTGLTPNTLYTVKVEVSGLHKLIGETSDAYTTPVQTTILSFSAVTGVEEGSVILSFTVDGMDSDTWSVTYSTEGEEPVTETFTGHMVNISGLATDKTYTFQLESGSDLYVVGNDLIEYIAVPPVFAENLAIVDCTEDSLTVSWNAPEGIQVESWTVRCYSDFGYNETIETTDTTVEFTGLNGSEAHTVEVTASGMSSGNRCYMTANAVSISEITASTVDATKLLVSWEFTGPTPLCNWLVVYTVDGSAFQQIVRSENNSAVITPIVPGAEYSIDIQLEDGTTVITDTFTTLIPEAKDFSGYLLSAESIEASMCRTPDTEGWDRNDLDDDDYTDTFKVGQKASFVLYSGRNYNRSDDVITTMFVIHSEDVTLISADTTQQVWTNMWYKRYCELDVPALPETPGTYSIEIYFNGTRLHAQNFTVTEE